LLRGFKKLDVLCLEASKNGCTLLWGLKNSKYFAAKQ
jgi:hypothetical protein